MKKLVVLGFIAVAAFATNNASAQLKTAYVSIDEVVQLMPEYKKAMGDLAQPAVRVHPSEALQHGGRCAALRLLGGHRSADGRSRQVPRESVVSHAAERRA